MNITNKVERAVVVGRPFAAKNFETGEPKTTQDGRAIYAVRVAVALEGDTEPEFLKVTTPELVGEFSPLAPVRLEGLTEGKWRPTPAEVVRYYRAERIVMGEEHEA